jgi:hypothetical protein
MEKEFIPYEQALELKELGFDEPCLTWWNKKEFVYPYWEREFGYNYESGIAKDCVLSPLYQQAFRWFREKYILDSIVQPTYSTKYQYRVFNLENKSKVMVYGYYMGEEYKTYEEAELECLKKLIQIVKQ